MSKFPLYDNLSRNIPTIDLTLAQKRLFVKRIEKIDQNGHELVYALIRMYQVENREDISFTIPYEGIITPETGINFNIDNLPIQLKHILFKFSEVHIEKMKEEEKIMSQTPVRRV